MSVNLVRARSTSPILVAALVLGLSGLVSVPSALAQAVASAPMSDDQAAAAHETLGLVQDLLQESLDKKLSDLFNNPGQPNIDYEQVNGEDPTLGDAIKKLHEMIEAKRLRAAKVAGGTAVTDPAPGQDADQVHVGGGLLSLAASTSDFERVKHQLLLASTLLNELVHVYQKFEGSDPKQCDAERDSHNSSLLIMCTILNALSNDAGQAYNSIADVAAESPAMAAYLTKHGQTAGHEIRALWVIVKTKKAELTRTRDKIFNANIAANVSWGEAYYGAGDYKGPHNYLEKNRNTLPHSIDIDSLDDSQTVHYFVPSGWDLINAVLSESETEQTMLMAVIGDATGQRALKFWGDTGTDGLPEPNDPSPLFPLTPAPAGTPVPESARIFDGVPIAFGTGGQNDGFLMLDTQLGRATLIHLSSNGLAIGAPLDLFQHPMLTAGSGFIYQAGHAEVATNVYRFIFSNLPPVAQFGHVGGAWFDYSLMSQQVVGTSNGAPQTLAQSFIPKNDVGIERLEPAQSNSLRLRGNPNSIVQMFAVSGGFMQPIANGMVQPDGATPPLVANNPLAGSTLYAIQEGNTVQYAFLPRLGQNVASALLDETGDGAAERIQMSVQPARLHIMAGLTGLPPNSLAVQYAFEQVVEDPAASAITPWQVGQPRILFVGFDEIELIPINAVQPPLYVQSQVDMDGDVDADEAVAIYSDPGVSPDYVAQVYAGAGARGSAVISTLSLPAGFEPDGYWFDDLNLDGALDVATRDFFTGEALRLFNDGDGVLFFSFADGDADDDGDVDLIDYAAFADCHAGPNAAPQPVGALSPTECLEVFDHDADVDVDLADALDFQQVFTETRRAADPSLTVIRRTTSPLIGSRHQAKP